MKLFFKKAHFADWFIVPSVRNAKGLVIAWHNNIEMNLLSSNVNVCHFETKMGIVEVLITCVYGEVDPEDKFEQWSYIANIAQQVNKPWILIGDLNVNLDPDEKQGGNKTSSSSNLS